MITINKIEIGRTTATVYYTTNKRIPGSGNDGPSRMVRRMTTVVDLDKLAASGALNIHNLIELI